MLLDNMLHNRQSQPGASALSGASLIYTVKAFKDPALMFLRNPDPRILYGQPYPTGWFFLHAYRHASTRSVIADSVVAQMTADTAH